MQTKKIYVCSSKLAVVVIANGPLDAIKKALRRVGNNKTLNSDFVYLDERGFRQDDTAQYKVPVEQAMTEAGYVFDDQEDADTGLSPPIG